MTGGPDEATPIKLLLLGVDREDLAVVHSSWPSAEVVALSPDDALGVTDRISREKIQMVFCGLFDHSSMGLQLLRQIRRVYPRLPLIVVLPEQAYSLALTAFRQGADDVLVRPLDGSMLRECQAHLARSKKNGAHLRRNQQVANRSLNGLTLLNAVGESMRSADDLQNLLERIVALIQSALEVDIVSLMLAGDDGVLKIRASHGLPDEVRQGEAIASTESVSAYVMEHGEPVLIDDLSSDGRFPIRDAASHYRRGSLLSVPVLCQQRPIGVLNINNKRNDEAFSGIDQELLMMIAHQTALAIENIKLLGNLQDKNQEIERAHADLVRLHQDRTRFVCNLSHELKTPLTSVLGFSDLLLNFFDQIDSDKLREYIAGIYNEGKHLEHVLTGMLRLFSIDSGSEDWHWQSLSLNECFDKALEGQKEAISESNLDLRVDLPDEILPIHGDRQKMELLLEALVDNAVKFNCYGGRLTITAGNLTLHGEPVVYLQITNQGHSVPREKAQDIFQEYSQLGDLDVGKPKGVGIGLATCRAILRQMQGEIFLEPMDGDGTSIGLLLPTWRDDPPVTH